MSKYKFNINPNDNSTHAKILSLVGQDKKVLDVGCSTGYIGKALKEHYNCEVTGIEADAEDATEAKEHYENIVLGDIEELELKDQFKKEEFDIAVFADVLGRLKDTKSAIMKVLPYCKEGIVISVPNISHASVIFGLLQGDFDYQTLGLLDENHLRFFTKKTAIDLLEECGLSVESILKTRVSAQNTEFHTNLSQFPKEIQDYIATQDESDTYQYVIKARKAEAGTVKEIKESEFSPKYLENRIKDLEGEISELKDLVTQRDHTIAWYSKTLKEQLTSHYAHKNIWSELCILKAEHKQLKKDARAMKKDRDRVVAHADRLQKYSPDTLPKLLGLPLKALIGLYNSGPFAPISVLKQKEEEQPEPEPRGMGDTPRVDVVTLLYNSEKFLDKYFEAVSKIKYPGGKLRIHVLDNASPDNSASIVREKYLNNPDIPFEVVLHESATNTGFAGGNNIVLKKLLADKESQFVFLLNHDTEVDPECINLLVQSMNADNKLGMAEAKQTPKEHPKYYDKDTKETSWCSGGCVLISVDALRKVGLFDERFFLYVEDVDLSWRMWLHGYKCKINPEALCTHYTEALNEDKDFSLQQYFSIRNTFYMRYKFGTKREIKEFEALFNDALEIQPDELSRNNLLKARKDAKANMKKFLMDRWKLSTKTRPHWIKFDSFNFGRTRHFEDTKDGRRIVFNEVA